MVASLFSPEGLKQTGAVATGNARGNTSVLLLLRLRAEEVTSILVQQLLSFSIAEENTVNAQFGDKLVFVNRSVAQRGRGHHWRRNLLHEDELIPLRRRQRRQYLGHRVSEHKRAAALTLRLQQPALWVGQRLRNEGVLALSQPRHGCKDRHHLPPNGVVRDEARQHLLVTQQLLHLLRAREVVGDGGALHGRARLHKVPRLPAALCRVVCGGVAGAEVRHQALDAVDDEGPRLLADAAARVDILQRVAHAPHLVVQPHVLLQDPLVRHVQLALLHHKQHCLAGLPLKSRQVVDVATATRPGVRREGRRQRQREVVGRRADGHSRLQRGDLGRLAGDGRGVAVEPVDERGETGEGRRNRVDLNLLHVPRGRVVRAAGVQHVVAAVHAKHQALRRHAARGVHSVVDRQQAAGELVGRRRCRQGLAQEVAVTGHIVDEAVEHRRQRLRLLEERAREGRRLHHQGAMREAAVSASDGQA
eukprot:Rhum_TRINITY_DN18771_c0_g1::Rhum_TRINITY_DN18771_c0_g1_i1::g.168380::m.168380